MNNIHLSPTIEQICYKPHRGHYSASGGGGGSLPSDALKTAREAAEASGEALPVFIGRAVETQAQRDSITRKMKNAPDKKSEA